MADWRPSQFRLAGGLNEEDPQFTQPPGAAAFMQNYECLPGGGYRRIGGYDRFNGTFWATDTDVNTYHKMAFINGFTEPLTMNIEVGTPPSFNMAAVLVAVELTSGSWAAGDAAGNFIVTGLTSFGGAEDDDIFRSSVTGEEYAYLVAGEPTIGSLEDADFEEWTQLAVDYWRTQIPTQVGGPDTTFGVCTGPTQGVFVFEGSLYAWRSSAADSTKIRLFKATTSATWTEVTPMPYIPFDNGTAELSIGDAVVGGTSAATGTVHEINIAEGNFSGPTYAAGRLFLTGITGVWQDNEEIRVAGVKKALVNGTITTPTPSSGTQLARHKTVVTNFYGADDRLAVYGVDGYNDPYTFDGTYLMYFSNTMATYPQFIEVHRNHLFLAYPGGSVQNSATGFPLIWSVRQGAAEIGIGDDPTGMKSNGNNTLAITAEQGIHILTGTSDLDWNLRVIADESGSLPDTIAGVGGQTLFLDRAGVSWLLPAPPTFQDYTTQQISRNIRKTIEAKAENALFALSVPSKSQYRLFLDDGTVLIAAFFANKLAGWSKAKYLDQMTCGVTGIVTAGSDSVNGVFMGVDDGYVVMCDSGPTFIGENIQSIVQLPFNYHGAPDRDKRFHKLTLEMETPASIDLRVHMDFDYGTGTQTGNFVTPTGATGGLWDISLWEHFFWDSGVLTAPETNIDGVGRNCSITLVHDSNTAQPFIISAALLQYSLYGVRR